MKISNQKGQSLLELLVALFILVSALAATVVLIVTSINAGREGRNRLIATNLAREGIELVRNIRDSNWSDPNSIQWNDGLTFDNGSTNDTTAVPIIDSDHSSPLFIDFSADGITDDQWTRIRQTGVQYLQYQDGGNSAFYRILRLTAICRKDDGGSEALPVKNSFTGNDCDAGYSEVGVRVISEVCWPSSGSNKKVIIEDRLYDWQILL